MNFEITKEEIEAIKNYKNDKNLCINQLLLDNAEMLISQENKIEITTEIILENIEMIKKIYEAMVKSFYQNPQKEDLTLYRGTNIYEIDKLKNDSNINQFLMATLDKEKAKNKFASNWSRPALIQIKGNSDVPYINLNNILNENEDDIIIAPFTDVFAIKNISNDDKDSDNSLQIYNLSLQNQKMERLDENDKNQLYQNILKKADSIIEKLNDCIELDNENAVNYENIRKLEQLLAKHNFAMEQENYEKDTTEAERQSDLDDIARINLELTSLKDTVNKIFNIRLQNLQFISDWKKDIIKYLKSEFAEINSKYSEQSSNNQKFYEEDEKENSNEGIATWEATENPIVDSIKSDCLENIAVVNTLLTNIKNLISKQQNHARIAEELGANYKALNNAFEMKNFAEELDSLVKAILNKMDTSSSIDKEELDKISKTNLQISILLNYLNNAKAAVSKKISRFDEINIIEENELKKEIAEMIKNIRCEAELKKLRDDLEIIEDKSSLKKFLGRFTGKNKLDKAMLDQIEVRQKAIRRTFKAKMPLAYNYSIHELIAEIEMFIKENEGDELILEDINNLRKIKDILKKNFVIMDSKVVSIIDQKTGKNLPLASRKMTKKELIEIDTYRFLNRYGYDKSYDAEEPEYQDTLPNEIKRIIDYIKSSGVL